MPYVIKQFKNKGYKVYEDYKNGKPLSKKYFPTYEDALRQLRAVILSELRRGTYKPRL